MDPTNRPENSTVSRSENYWLSNFPLAPSVNRWLNSNKKGQFYKSAIWRSYRSKTDWYWLQHRRALDILSERLKSAIKTGDRLRVDCYFVFHVERIHLVDPDNFLKASLDSLAGILGIDDSFFYAGHREKVTTANEDPECAMIRISTMRPRTQGEIRALVDQDSSST